MNEDSARFCESCGMKLEEETGAPTPEEPGAPTPEEPGAPTPEEPGAPTPEEPGAPTPEEPGAPTPEELGAPTPEEPGAPIPEGTEPYENSPGWPEEGADYGYGPEGTGGYGYGPDGTGGYGYGPEGTDDYGYGAGQDTVPLEDPSQYGDPQRWEEPGRQRNGGKLSVLQKAVIIEAVCLVAVVIAFFMIGRNKYNAQSVAERYFDAYAAHDWETVYDLLELPKGAFMQESQFADMMDKMQLPNITNYKVRARSGTDNGITRNFSVEYTATGQGTSNAEMTLVRQSDKALFLFDEWKVSTEGMLSESYPIIVPAGAQVAVDGIRLSEDYQVSSEYEGMDTYQISVFNGVHSISVAAPWCEVYEGQFDTSLDGSFMVSDLTVSEAGRTAFEAKMQEALEKFYSSAIAGADYADVEGLFSADAAADYESEYNDLKDQLADDPDDYYTLNQITFDNFNCSFYTESGAIGCDMDCDYKVDYTYTYGSFGRTRNENSSSDGKAYVYASFVYEGDTYKLKSVSIPDVWW